ncbi:MAG: GcrA family cell cycle regulator [Amaricoccus sp.]
MSWTDERVETLKSMWSDGKSASQIAKELGGVTRNAVIGKVHRLGLSNRAGGDDGLGPDALLEEELPDPAPEAAAPQPAATPLVRPAGKDQPPVRVKPTGPLPPQPAGSEITPEALANLAEVAKKARRLTLMQLTERTCKWPVGDPATDDFWFCGLPTVAGKPYCETHVAVAFQPMSARRDRRAGGR